jgi:putative ABC transport system permease protein
MSERRTSGARRILVATAWLVPAHRRRVWLRQWQAEIEHRSRLLGASAGLGRFRREEMTMRGWWGEVRASARALLRAPGFTALTVVTLAIGIGAASGVFSLVETMVLRPVPLPGGDRLVAVFSSNPQRGFGRFSVSYPDFADFSERSDLFETTSFYTPRPRDLSGDLEPERVRTVEVHTDFFDVLQSGFRLGRPFDASDHATSASPTAVLSEALWVRRYGSDPAVLGSAVRIDGVPHTVVGVVASGQGWPREAQIWVPLRWGGVVPDFARPRSNHTWQVIGRLQPEVAVAEADAQIRALAATIYAGPDVDRQDEGIVAEVVSLQAAAAGDDTPAILTVMAVAVGLVLLIACLNASGLLLTRAWSRSHELALRTALGAARIRVAAILIGESLLLALAGGALGVGLALYALRRVVSGLPLGGPDLSGIELNLSVAAVALCVSVVASLVAGAVPAVRASRTQVAEALKDGSTGSGGGPGRSRFHRGLVVVELSLSLALLVSAGLTVQGLQRQVAVDPGFDHEDLLTFTVRLPAARYPEADLVDAYYREAVTALERLPFVRAATSTSRLPLGAGGFGLYRSFAFDGEPRPPEGAEYAASWIEVDPGYFSTLGIEPREGRAFTGEDESASEPVAIVSRSLARRMSPDASIVGRPITSIYDENVPRTVVGVFDDLQFGGLAREEPEATVFVPRSQAARTAMAFLIRTEGDPTPHVAEIRAVMASLDGDLAMDDLRTLREAHNDDLAGIRFLTILFGSFGVGALALALSGVYGLVAYTVSQRTREFGVRMALGASAAEVRWSVVRDGMTLALVGVGVGTVIAYALSRALTAALFGIAGLDPATFVWAAAALVLAVALASWGPARAATRVDPVEALRTE